MFLGWLNAMIKSIMSELRMSVNEKEIPRDMNDNVKIYK
mgnify:FL=1